MSRVDAAFAASLLPGRLGDSHKGDYGKVLLLCGSEDYVGAARLAAEGCLRSGAGLICLGAPRSIYPILASSCPPEIMCRPLPEDEDGRLSYEALSDIREYLDWCDAALIGPGLGRSRAIDRLVRRLCNQREKPLVVDADGLNALGEHILVQREAPLFLTPHDGEFELLGGDHELSRSHAAKLLAAKTGAVVVRKGHVTLTVSPQGTVYTNTSGNPGMAKGGSGDVLAGFLTGFVAQKAADPARWEAVEWTALAACAVFWHGRSGDLCAKELGMYGMTPSDIVAKLPLSMHDEENQIASPCTSKRPGKKQKNR